MTGSKQLKLQLLLKVDVDGGCLMLFGDEVVLSLVTQLLLVDSGGGVAAAGRERKQP